MCFLNDKSLNFVLCNGILCILHFLDFWFSSCSSQSIKFSHNKLKSIQFGKIFRNKSIWRTYLGSKAELGLGWIGFQSIKIVKYNLTYALSLLETLRNLNTFNFLQILYWKTFYNHHCMMTSKVYTQKSHAKIFPIPSRTLDYFTSNGCLNNVTGSNLRRMNVTWIKYATRDVTNNFTKFRKKIFIATQIH